jgi:hypothetical protein
MNADKAKPLKHGGTEEAEQTKTLAHSVIGALFAILFVRSGVHETGLVIIAMFSCFVFQYLVLELSFQASWPWLS